MGGPCTNARAARGWGVAQKDVFTGTVLAEAFGDAKEGDITASRLQESRARYDARRATAHGRPR